MEKSIDYPEGNVKKIDLVYMAGALASVVNLLTVGGMKSWRIYERCSINRVQTLNEAKMINKPQKPPCFIPRVVCWRTFTHERSNVAIKIKNANGGLFI